MLLGSVIYDLRTSRVKPLYDIFRNIVLNLNAIQGIRKIDENKKKTKELNIRFSNTCIRRNIKFSTAIAMIKNRSKNFNISIGPDNVSYDTVCERGVAGIGIYYSDK